MKISKKWLRLSNLICAILMVALLVLQFLPYWTFPACTCSELCKKLKYDKDCPLCRATYKLCVHTPANTADLKYTITPKGDYTFFKIEHDLNEPLSWDYITVYYEIPASASNSADNTEAIPDSTKAPETQDVVTDDVADATVDVTEETAEVTDATVDATEETAEVTNATVDATEETAEVTDATVGTTEDTTVDSEPTEAVDETTEATKSTSSGFDGRLELSPIELGLKSDDYYTGTVTVENVTLSLTQIGVDGSGILMHDEDGSTSLLFNTTALPGKIDRLVLEYNAMKPIFNNKDAVIVSFGTAQDNMTETSTVSTETDRVDYRSEWDVSIQQYTWTSTFPGCLGVTSFFNKHFQDLYENKDFVFMLKDIVLMPVLVLVGALTGLYLCIVKGDKPLVGIVPLIVGISGVISYLTMPVFQTNNALFPNMWMVHLGVSALITLVSLVSITECIFRVINWCNPKKAQ